MDLRIRHLLPFGSPGGLNHLFPVPESVTIEHEPPEESGKRLLVVDDEADIRTILVRYLTRLGHSCAEARTGLEAIDTLRSDRFDAVLTDIRMPQMTGIELLGYIKKYDENLAVVMITANQEAKDAILAMKLGADDYILKPFNFQDVSVGLDRALEKRELKRKIRSYQQNLEKMVVTRTSHIQRLFVSVIQSLVYTLEAKDPYTNGHSRRVAWLGMQLGRAAGLGPRELEIVQMGAIFHDLGKIGIREMVLLKDGPLTVAEYDHVKLHPGIGVQILEPLEDLTEILPLVLHHHEQYNGRGYPARLQGEEIPPMARLVAVVDAFDAMTSDRPYRKALLASEAMSRLNKGAGSQFDPRLVALFLPLAEDKELQDTLRSAVWRAGVEGASGHAYEVNYSGSADDCMHNCEES